MVTASGWDRMVVVKRLVVVVVLELMVEAGAGSLLALLDSTVQAMEGGGQYNRQEFKQKF
jgi:hypothetical protein